MGVNCTNVGSSSPKTNKDLKKDPNDPPKISTASTSGSIPVSKTIVKKDERDNLIVKKETFVIQKDFNPDEQYILLQEIGSGSYATVNLVKHRLTEVERAMKKIQKDKKLTHDQAIQRDKEIMNEIDIVKSIDHPNIVKIYEFFITPEKYYLITEYCQGGELYDQFEKYCPFDEFHAAFIIYQLFCAVHYCHLRYIVHRDLKPENILIEKKNADGLFVIKVIDFGTAKLFQKEKMQRTLIGSPYYIAPEVINRNYNQKCDLWSIGVILYTLLSCKLPFNGEDDNEVFENIKKGEYKMDLECFSKVSADAKDLISRLLVVEPEKRINLIDVFQHPFFTKKNMKDYNMGVSVDNVVSCLKNINNYKSEFVLQTTVIAFLVHNFTQHDVVKDVSKFFNIFDNQVEQGDGKLTREEVVLGLAKFMPKAEVIKSVDAIFTKIDRDCNGFIEYEEFVGACIDKNIFLKSNIMQFAFNFFDRDNSGFIDLNELEIVFCNERANKKKAAVCRRMLQDVIKSIDLNGDNTIDLKEFTLMMEKIIKPN